MAAPTARNDMWIQPNGGIEGTQGFIRYADSFQKPAGIPLVLESAAQYSNDKIAIQTPI